MLPKAYTILLLLCTTLFFSCVARGGILTIKEKTSTVSFHYDISSEILTYGKTKLSAQLKKSGYAIVESSTKQAQYQIHILTLDGDLFKDQNLIVKKNNAEEKRDGYKLTGKKRKIYVYGDTERGCLYGIMDIIDQLETGSELTQLEEKEIDPAFSFRAIKFNLPWSPYREGPATELHIKTCRDLTFWEAYLDMMVKNRFNAISLWNNHPFPYMIRAKNYPMATSLSDEELKEWQFFWKTLFKMAKNRGIETYLVNWNIVTSPEFAKAYGTEEYSDRSELVKKYTRESVTQVINEYKDLTGLGVTLADWMGNWGDELMTGTEREDWIAETFIEGINQADRKIKFIHRAVLAGDPKEMRRILDKANLPDKTNVEVKFNWSHGHSTPKLSLTHAQNDGTIMKGFWDPKPENYFISWMIRNEDFFVLRWGDPTFIRDHIKTNNLDYVDGYFIGSEGYIPAKDYSHIENHPHRTWKYAFQKQWLFYHLWGRLTYNPNETDEKLAAQFNIRYKNVNALSLLNAHTLSSKVPEYIASYYKSTWDYTLYSEGFMSVVPTGFDDGKSAFISIQELINHETLDSKYISIQDYVNKTMHGNSFKAGEISPLELAQTIDNECNKALSIVESLYSENNIPLLNSELDDITTWCHLGFYFSDKLRAGVALQTFNIQKQAEDKTQALTFLGKCLGHWENVVKYTIDRYQQMPYVSMGHVSVPKYSQAISSFHWSNFLKDVEADITYVKNIEKNE
ncbi:MAG: hypothetical protein ACI9K1_000216 [Arcticibacterium sp.]|jgi:hypothetical protein